MKAPAKIPKGFVLLKTGPTEPPVAACLNTGNYHGWLMQYTNEQWKPKRRLADWEIMQAADLQYQQDEKRQVL